MENCKCDEYKDLLDIQSSKISCLEYENKENLNRIIVLEKYNQELKKENKKLNNRIIVLEKDNQEFKNKINNLEFEKTINKIITAIQDINSINNLEKIILIKSLFKLRKLRNSNNHYIDEDCNDYQIDCRKLYLLTKLKEFTHDQIILINNRICKNEDLISEIIKYLDSNVDKQIQINEDELEDIENWWLY